MELNNVFCKELETKDLVLKPFKLEYAESMYKNWATDPNVIKFLAWDLHKNVQETETVISHWLAKQEFQYDWAIYLKSEDEIIGAINVVDISKRYFNCEIGYCLGSKWWGKGYMTQALQAVIAFMFDEVGVNRVQLKHAVENIGSGRVMEKCGMQVEGVLRQGTYAHGKFFDARILSILKDEYLKGKNS